MNAPKRDQSPNKHRNISGPYITARPLPLYAKDAIRELTHREGDSEGTRHGRSRHEPGAGHLHLLLALRPERHRLWRVSTA